MGLFFFNRYKNELSFFLDHLLKCISQVSFLQGLSSLQVDDARSPILKSLKTKERLFPCLTEKVKLEGERWISDTKLLCYLKVRTSSTSYTTDCTSFDGSMFFFHWDIRTKLKHNYLWGVWLCFITTLTPHACNSTHWLQTWASTEAKRKHFGFCSLTLPFPAGIKHIFCILKSLLK